MSRGRSRPGSLLPYWAGRSWLHRAPAGAKLAGLVVGAAALAAIGGAVASSVAAAGVLGTLVLAGAPVGLVWRQVRPILVGAAVVVGFQVLLGRTEAGLVAGTRILAVAALAIAVTLTTSHAEMLGWLERTLRRVGVRPAARFRVALTIGIALRSIDHLGVVAERVLDARRARGLGRSLRAFAVPTATSAAMFAHGVGEALEARGIAEPDLPPDRGRDE